MSPSCCLDGPSQEKQPQLGWPQLPSELDFRSRSFLHPSYAPFSILHAVPPSHSCELALVLGSTFPGLETSGRDADANRESVGWNLE